MKQQSQGAPRASLSVLDGALMMVGIIIGIGIFKFPQLVALNVGSEIAFILIWLAGGVVTLIGALVYAELAAAYPSTGGEYHFLTRAFGRNVGFMFAWARTTVIQTGAIALVAFALGDYAQEIYSLGANGPAIYAAAAVGMLTLLNVIGTYQSKTTQNLLSSVLIVAMLTIVAVALASGGGTAKTPAAGPSGAFGLAMVFVLLTYGGWNETAYLSAEVRNVRRDMIRILLAGTAIVTLVYLLVNFAYLHVLGLDGLRKTGTVAADVMRLGLGASAAIIVSLIICFAALSTMNATIFTGARLYHALGQDFSLRRLRAWSDSGNNPRNAILVQSAVAAALVLFGAFARDGFTAMVEYTAPVFWFFLLMVGIGFFVLRRRDPGRERPFRVPLYPLTPALFCLTCVYLFYSSLAYTGLGAIVGVTVLVLGAPVLFVIRTRQAPEPAE
jgi:amino acid transporter